MTLDALTRKTIVETAAECVESILHDGESCPACNTGDLVGVNWHDNLADNLRDARNPIPEGVEAPYVEPPDATEAETAAFNAKLGELLKPHVDGLIDAAIDGLIESFGRDAVQDALLRYVVAGKKPTVPVQHIVLTTDDRMRKWAGRDELTRVEDP